MDFVGDRDILDLHQQRRSPEYFDEYATTRNSESVDALPGL
jgi:hypothetical protein